MDTKTELGQEHTGALLRGKGTVPSLHHRDGPKGTKHGSGQSFPIAVMWKGLKTIVIITITMPTKSFGELKSGLLHRLPVEELAQVWPPGDLEEFQTCSFPISGGLLWAEG